jgi:hypothetical protein
MAQYVVLSKAEGQDWTCTERDPQEMLAMLLNGASPVWTLDGTASLSPNEALEEAWVQARGQGRSEGDLTIILSEAEADQEDGLGY